MCDWVQKSPQKPPPILSSAPRLTASLSISLSLLVHLCSWFVIWVLWLQVEEVATAGLDVYAHNLETVSALPTTASQAAAALPSFVAQAAADPILFTFHVPDCVSFADLTSAPLRSSACSGACATTEQDTVSPWECSR